MRAKLFCLYLLVLTLCLASGTLAQVPDPILAAQAPMPGSGHHYIGIGAETVNPADGSLSFELPLQTPPGRQLSFPFGIHYNTSEQFSLSTHTSSPAITWDPITASPYELHGWGYQLPTYSAQSFTKTSSPNPNNPSQSLFCIGSRNYIFRGFDGVQRSLALSNTWPDPSSTPTPNCNGGAILGSNLHGVSAGAPPSYVSSATQPPLTIADPSGTTYQFPQTFALSSSDPSAIQFWGLLAQTITDRNGNQMTYTGATNGGSGINNSGFTVAAGSYKDTLGRQIVSWSGLGSTSGDQLTISGLPSNIVVHWTTVNVSFPETGHMTSGSSSCQMGNTSTQQISGVSEIDLPGVPNGQKYTFAYDPTHGRVSKITFPGGGYVRYAWGLNASSAATLQQWTPSAGNNQFCYFIFDVPAISDRFVSYDGTTEVLHQHFNYFTTWVTPPSAPPSWTSKRTIVTSTDLLTNQVATTTYAYVGDGPDLGPNDTSSFAPGTPVPVEQSIVYQDGGGHTLKTVNKTWRNAFAMIGAQTILDNGQGTATLLCYGTGEQVTDVYEYGFQSEGPKPADPSCYTTALQAGSAFNGALGLNNSAIGPLKRHTATLYHSFPNTNILNEPDSITVFDGSGTQAKQTTLAYDGSSVQASSAATGLVAVSTARGNPTSVTRWLNTGSPSPTTTYAYYDTGQIRSKTDACGNTACSDMTGTNHTTTYSYTDNFSCGMGTPPGQTNAYLRQVTYPNTGAAHTETFCWGYNTGLLGSQTDQNGKLTSYQYSDPLERLTGTTYPDGGSTSVTYNDSTYNPSTPTPSFTTSGLMNSSNQFITALSATDGLGHPVQTRLTSDPDCTSGDRTATTYDGFGRVRTASNPYCSTGDSSYGLATSAYDPLGRTLTVTTQDGSTTTTSYSGSCGTVTDPASKVRTACSDGLGRLTQVTEAPGGLGYVTTYTYDVLDNLTGVLQNGSHSRSFQYDSLSRLTSATNPESHTIGYAYDANGNVITKTDGRSISTNYSYDALNRVTLKSYSDGSLAMAYQYDRDGSFNGGGAFGIGRMTVSSRGDGSVADHIAYDSMGRVALVRHCLPGLPTNVPCGSATYSYDLAGNLSSLTYPSGRTVKYQYNGASRPNLVTFDNLNGISVGYNYLTAATYTPNGSPTTITLGTGLTETNGYNSRLQICSQQIATSAATLLNKVYNFYPTAGATCQPGTGGNNGNVMGIADNLVPGRTQAFSYDSLNRISTAQTSATSGADCWAQSFGYDAWGNLLTETPTRSGCPMTTLNATVNANNQITNSNFSYDLAGNLLADGTGGNHYVYDAESRIKSLNSGAATYTYAADGNRVIKSVGADQTDYIHSYANGDVLAEYKPATSTWTDYIFVGGRRLASASATVSTPAGGSVAGDPLQNGGFEQGAQNWSFGSSSQIITDATRAHSGSNYLQISSSSLASAHSTQLMAVSPGNTVNFGGWAYRESGTTGSCRWKLEALDANQNAVAFLNPSPSNVSSATWTFQTGSYTVPSNVAFVFLYAEVFNATAPTVARFDDGSVDVGTGNFDPGFERGLQGCSTVGSPITANLIPIRPSHTPGTIPCSYPTMVPNALA